MLHVHTIWMLSSAAIIFVWVACGQSLPATSQKKQNKQQSMMSLCPGKDLEPTILDRKIPTIVHLKQYKFVITVLIWCLYTEGKPHKVRQNILFLMP